MQSEMVAALDNAETSLDLIIDLRESGEFPNNALHHLKNIKFIGQSKGFVVTSRYIHD